LSIHIEHGHSDEFNYLYQRFNAMVQNLNKLIEQVYKQKILAQHAELKQLQAQINPHFLYNTYYVLYSMAKAEDNENVIYFLKLLGNYFQYITRISSDFVPLFDEAEHARTYTEIQMLRFTNRVLVEFGEVPPAWHKVQVPRLIIQPIIENTFKYVLEDKSECSLRISFTAMENHMSVVIEDNGDGMADEQFAKMNTMLSDQAYDGEITALLNIHRRLQLRYGDSSGMKIARSELGGLKVELIIFDKGSRSDV
jgi:two-component system sensor histidine kinase YesM